MTEIALIILFAFVLVIFIGAISFMESSKEMTEAGEHNDRISLVQSPPTTDAKKAPGKEMRSDSDEDRKTRLEREREARFARFKQMRLEREKRLGEPTIKPDLEKEKEINDFRLKRKAFKSAAEQVYRAKACSRCLSPNFRIEKANLNTGALQVQCTYCEKPRWIRPLSRDLFMSNRSDLSHFLKEYGRIRRSDEKSRRLTLSFKEPLPSSIGKRKPIPKDVQRFVRERDGDECVLCGSTVKLHLDHIIPVSKGGGNQVENLRVLCQDCNLRKGAGI